MPRPIPSEREFAVSVVKTLRDAGHEALFAGGCVRDELLGLTPKDYDVATSARPETVQALFRRTVAVGAAFGVIDVLGPRPLAVQVATFRADGSYSDGRRPDSVVYCSAEEDAKRRDFTINGMFFDPLAGEVRDYVGGRADLDAKILRAIGDARERFDEDRLRMLRAVRIAARFGLTIDDATGSAITRMASQLADSVSTERIADELRKILADKNRVEGVRLFAELGLAAVVLPEAVTDGRVLGRLASPSFALALSSLLLDAGPKVAEAVCLRLKLSNEDRAAATWLVGKRRALDESRTMTAAALKRLSVHPLIEEMYALAEADALAAGRDVGHVRFAVERRRAWAEAGELDPPPLLTGNDLIGMGIPQGPVFKTLLDKVRTGQLDGTLTSADEARAFVRRFA